MAAEKSDHLGLETSSDVLAKQERRRIMKPITERLRRERINHNLNELKLLVLTAMNEDVSQYTRMEKADILEMTVQYIQHIQKKKPHRKGSCVSFQERSPKVPRTTAYGSQSNNSNDAPVARLSVNSPEGMETLLTSNVVPCSSSSSPPHSTPMDSSRKTDITQNIPLASDLPSCSHEPDEHSCHNPHFLSACYSPKRAVSVATECSFAGKSRSPLKILDNNELRVDGTEVESPVCTPKKKLPGMECFVQGRGSWNSIPTNKENNSLENQFAFFYGNQLYSPVWRPWY